MHDDRLKALIEQADANPPACHATPLELAGQVRVLYRRRRRHRASLLAAAAILVAVGLAFWLQIDRGASQLQLADVATPSSPQSLQLAKPPVGLPPAEKRPSRDPSEVTSSPRPPNAYERLALAAYQRTRGGRQPRSPSKSRKAAGRQGDPVDFAIEQLVIQPDRCTRETAQPLLANREWSEAVLAARIGRLGGPRQVAAIRLLAEIATPRSLALLRECSALSEVHVEVVRRMARLDDSPSLGRLAQEEQHSSLRQELLSMLLARGDPGSVQVFLDRVEDPHTSADALECLALVPDPPVEILFQCLHGPLVVRRMAAARVLGRLDQPVVSRQLIAMVVRGMYRQEAMIALLSSLETTARQFLAAVARDPTLSAVLWNAKRQIQSLSSWRS